MMLKSGLTFTSSGGNGRAVRAQRRKTGGIDFENFGGHDAVARGRLFNVGRATLTVRQLRFPFLCIDQLYYSTGQYDDHSRT